MDAPVKKKAETAAHARLKRAALLWAQAQGFLACACEVQLPRCRYRADLAAYRKEIDGRATTAIFECKQTRCDLRRDNCSSSATRLRLHSVSRRRQLLEKHLRVHYPALRIADSLFAEFDSHNFAAIGHRSYERVVRELKALQRRLYDSTKFENLLRYRCANLFFLVLTNDIFDDAEIPPGWGALVEGNNCLRLLRKPTWHETSAQESLLFLYRIALAGTRLTNRQLEITFEEVVTARAHFV